MLLLSNFAFKFNLPLQQVRFDSDDNTTPEEWERVRVGRCKLIILKPVQYGMQCAYGFCA
jgi:hypothetical protein